MPDLLLRNRGLEKLYNLPLFVWFYKQKTLLLAKRKAFSNANGRKYFSEENYLYIYKYS